MVHEMEPEVDVAILVGIRKLAHDGEMISSSFNDLCPSEAGIKVLHEVTTSASNTLNKTVSIQLKRCAPGEAVVVDEIFAECRLQATSIFIAEVSWRLRHAKFQSLVQSWENVLVSICLAQLCDLEGNLEHDGVRYNNVLN
jgi:hypothetical protein